LRVIARFEVLHAASQVWTSSGLNKIQTTEPVFGGLNITILA
jgi:hypothetical protein